MTATLAKRIVFRTSLSRIALVLGPLGLVALTAGGLAFSRRTPDAWAGLLVGILFVTAAAFFTATQRALVLDPATRRWQLFRGFVHRSRDGDFEELSAVRLAGQLVPDAGLEEETHYVVELLPVEGEPLRVLDSEDRLEARRQAEALARRLRLPLRLPGDGGTLARSPDELDAAFRARFSDAGDDRADAKSTTEVALGPGGMSGANLAFAAGAAALLLSLLGLHLTAAMHSARVGWSFAAFALPFDVAALLLAWRALLAVAARRRLSVAGGWLEQRWLLGGRVVRTNRMLADRIERVSLDGDGLAVEDLEGRRWWLSRGRATAAGRALHREVLKLIHDSAVSTRDAAPTAG